MLLPADVAEQPNSDWRIASAVSWKDCIWFSKCVCGKTDGDEASPYQKFFKNSSKILREDSQTALQNSLATTGRRGEWPRKRNDWEQLQCQREEKGRWWAGETESPSLQDWGKIQNDKAAQSYTQFGNPILRNSIPRTLDAFANRCRGTAGLRLKDCIGCIMKSLHLIFQMCMREDWLRRRAPC